jgi:SAM-dependent methyltransferase
MLPTFAQLYAMAFSWDPAFEFQSVNKLFAIHGVENNCVIADVGAGTGRFVGCIVNHGFECYAIEPDLEMFKELEVAIEKLSKESNSRATPVRSLFENFDPSRKLDAIITMTDTLSYVLPESRLSLFLSQAKYSLNSGGVFVIDVAIWANYIGEARSEQWSSEIDGWVINSEYSAYISQLPDRQRMARRLETLTFEARRGEQLVERTRQREIFSFSLEDLMEQLSSHGFRYSEALEPGNLDLIDLRITRPKRAFLCFIKE